VGQFTDEQMVLLLGRIDDLEKVYLNNVLIGQSGEFSTETANIYKDMYKQKRGYYIPEGILNDNGMNVLVVKVLDWYGEGGIWDGSIGLITQDNYRDYWKNKSKLMR
jgi:sialate O-acetylesterase